MTGEHLTAGVAIGTACGCAFAGGLLALNAAPEKAFAGGALVAIGGFAFAAAVRIARRIGARTPSPLVPRTGRVKCAPEVRPVGATAIRPSSR
jgi:hypothetical protein